MSKRKSETANISLGQYLQKTRRNLKIRIEDAVKETKIRSSYVKAMEAGDFDELPGGVYTKGYLKSYAEFLELDPDDVFERFNKPDVKEEEEKPKSVLDEPAVSESYREDFSPSLMIVVVSIVAAIVVYAVWNKFYSTNDVKDSRAQKVLGVFSNPDLVVTLVANGNTEVVISAVDGQVLYKKNMEYGETYFIPKDEEVVLKVDDINSVEIYLDGEQVSSLSNLEEKSGGVLLDIKKLLANIDIQ